MDREFMYLRPLSVSDQIDLGMLQQRGGFQVKETKAEVRIFGCKVIDTVEGTSYDGQVFSGKKVVINGAVLVKAVISPNSRRGSITSIDRWLPFTTYIVIPRELTHRQYAIKYNIENISTHMISKDLIYVNVMVMLAYENTSE